MDGTKLGKLDLPSGGGWVEFKDLDDLTGKDLHALRRVIRQEDSAGQTTNELLTLAAALLVKTWNVDYLADPRTPEANPAWWKGMKLRDLRAIETAVAPLLELVREGVPGASLADQSPGSPTPPDGD